MSEEQRTGIPNTKVGDIILAEVVEIIELEPNPQGQVRLIGLKAGPGMGLLAPSTPYRVYEGDMVAVMLNPLGDNGVKSGVIQERVDKDIDLDELTFTINTTKE